MIKNKVPHGRSKSLPDQAITIMKQWYDNHTSDPYPNDAERRIIAEEGKISEIQVKSWFANKRNRENNTKTNKLRVNKDEKKKKTMTKAKPETKTMPTTANVATGADSVVNVVQEEVKVEAKKVVEENEESEEGDVLIVILDDNNDNLDLHNNSCEEVNMKKPEESDDKNDVVEIVEEKKGPVLDFELKRDEDKQVLEFFQLIFLAHKKNFHSKIKFTLIFLI